MRLARSFFATRSPNPVIRVGQRDPVCGNHIAAFQIQQEIFLSGKPLWQIV
jgi:hypothetical protein